MSKKNKTAWISFFAIIGAAIIGGVFMFFQKTSPSKINSTIQKNDSGNNNNNTANRDVNQNANTYNVSSNNQQGGITAGTVIIIKNVEFKKTDDNTLKVNVKDNFICELDTVNNIIKVSPKTGNWTSIFFGIPNNETKSVSPHFLSKNGSISSMNKASYQLQSDSIYALQATSIPATNEFFYSMHYQSLPTYIVFGNYPQPLYKVYLSSGL